MNNKIRIMNAKPEITDGEIQSYMDFDKLLRQKAEATGSNKRRLIKRISFGASGVALLAIWLFYQPLKETLSTDETGSEAQQSVQAPLKAAHDTVFSSGVDQSSPGNARSEQKKSTTTKGKTTTKVNTPSRTEAATKADSGTKTNDRVNAMPVYAQPEPVDGYPALYAYFSQALTYPAEAVADSVQGVVTVVFSINPEGRPEKITIEQSLGSPFDREAIRVIENMPLWKPATYNGKPVASKISLPLTFNIKKIKTP